jgi:uncharacterized protein (TIRG00374 family)
MNRRVLRLLEWAVALLLLGALFVWGDAGDLHRILHADVRFLLLGLAVTGCIATFTCAKWRTVVASLGRGAPPRWRRLYYYFFLGRVSGLVAPMTVSEAGVRVLSLRFGHRMSLTHAGYSVYLERSFDLIVVLVAFLPGILHLTGVLTAARAGLLLAALLVLCAAFLLRFPTIALRALAGAFLVARRLAGRIPLVERFLARGRRIQPVEAMPLPQGQALLLFALSFGGLFALALRFWIILRAVGVEISFLPLLLSVPVGQLLTLLAITPGGLGILEAGWYGIFTVLGVPDSQLVLAVLSARTFVVLFIIVMYFATWIVARAADGEMEEGREVREEAKVGPTGPGGR